MADTNGLNDITGTVGVVVYLEGVLVADAQALNNLIDGQALGVADPTAADLAGRVKYSVPNNGLVNVTIYVTHR